MPPRQRFHTEDIIDAAFNVVRKQGWGGLSARSIAKELGASTRPIYSCLESMKDIEEAVVEKAMERFHEYLNADITGDKWLDQAIGYIKFATEEKKLFRCINDETHTAIQRKFTRRMWLSLGEDLAEYPLFQNISDHRINRIRVMRWFLLHGLATLINNGWFVLEEADSQAVLEFLNIRLTDMLRIGNQVLYQGLKDDDIIKALGIEIGKGDSVRSDD